MHLKTGEHKHLLIYHTAGDSAQWDIVQEADSVLTIHLFALDSDEQTESDVRLTVRQAGAHAETYIYGIGLLHGSQQASVRTHVVHEQPYGVSRQLLKFIVQDEAQGAFVGELIVAPHAQHADAQQTNRNIVLSPKALMHTQPQLEIYADDVKCSHGATTGQLDESALFYMQQRGLDPQEARRLLLTAFFHDVIATLGNETIEERLNKKIAAMLETKNV